MSDSVTNLPPVHEPRRILITGATGFIGSHLTRRLKADGGDVHAIVRMESQAQDLHELLGRRNVHIHDGTMQGMLDIVKKSRPEMVFHLASLFLSQHATTDISRLVRSNIEFPAQLAEAMAVHHVPFLINTGTAWQHYEEGGYNPVNLYAATKQAYVNILRFYVETGAFRVLNLELFDTYGPEDTRPKLFSVLRKAALTGEALAMSAGEQLIDVVYIDDVIEAYVAGARRIQEAGHAAMETFVVSSEAPVSLRQLVERWQQATGRTLNIKWGGRPYRAREVMRPWRRGERIPGWRAAVTLEEGIRRMEGEGR
jgi:nucleoside-diphosphate-sugar epimerase